MTNSEIASFFLRHHFDLNLSVETLIQGLLYDMNLGLHSSENKFNAKAGEDMFKTWMLPPSKKPANEKVIVIDAGGTNFRSCLVSFDENGEASISDFKKSSMPGIERELSKSEFFSEIADRIDYLRGKAEKIGFCFSYAMEITEDGDGRPNAFSKEIKAKEVLGVPVGKTLAEELERRGWGKIKKIALLNDTVSALLAGSVASRLGTSCSSFVGFILGTGINAAYIQDEIKKSDGTPLLKKQIVVCESGKCDKIPGSDFDLEFDKKTAVPNQYPLEKQCSGAYLGSLSLETLRTAAGEGLFTEKTCKKILDLTSLSLIEMDSFLHAPFAPGKISDSCENDGDRRKMYGILDALIVRCAKNAAAILCAVCIQSGEGKDILRPIGILCNGTTFFKTHKLRSRIESYLDEHLTKTRGIHYEILTLEDDITLGTASAVCS